MMRAAPTRVTLAAMALVRRPWLDWAAAAALTAIGVAMTLGGSDQAGGTIVDSIVVAAVTLPLVWRRTAPFAAAAAVAAGAVVSGVPTFDQARCGVAIPVALLIVFSVAARRGRGEALAGLALVLAGMVVLLFTDPLLGTGALFILPLCAGVWSTGRVVRSRNRVAAELAERSAQLARTREDRARLAVELDRALIADDLNAAARLPLREMVELAEVGVTQSAEPARETFARIERQGRESLDAMRQMLGKLRSEELGTPSPQPTIADLERLLARQREAGTVVELRVAGERRALPAGIELAGYRMVQHALEALGVRPIDIALRYMPDALELEVRGHMTDGDAAEAALVAARERVTAHGGRFSRERGPDGSCVLHGHLPVATTGV
jgi:signal transduction histidine kinase